MGDARLPVPDSWTCGTCGEGKDLRDIVVGRTKHPHGQTHDSYIILYHNGCEPS